MISAMKYLVIAFCFSVIPLCAMDVKPDPSRVDAEVTLQKISGALWMHTGICRFDFGPCPSHGIVAVGKTGLVLVDTQWNDAQTKILIDRAEKRFGKKVLLAVVTHAHADKIGGIRTLLGRGVRVIGTKQIADAAERNGYPRPEAAVTANPQPFDIDGVRFEVFFPGAAHTADNITVYFSDEKVLFAGCIVKGAKDTTLGNTADGDVKAYPAAVSALMKRYPDAKKIVTSHSDPGGQELLTHTLEIAKGAAK